MLGKLSPVPQKSSISFWIICLTSVSFFQIKDSLFLYKYTKTFSIICIAFLIFFISLGVFINLSFSNIFQINSMLFGPSFLIFL